MKDYHQMLTKYREQAISEINRHYDYLEREVLTQISNRYAHHLQNLIPPIENLYGDFQKHLQNIKRNDKSIETMIVINSTQCILNVQELLLKIKVNYLIYSLKRQILKLNYQGFKMDKQENFAWLVKDYNCIQKDNYLIEHLLHPLKQILSLPYQVSIESHSLRQDSIVCGLNDLFTQDIRYFRKILYQKSLQQGKDDG